MQEGDVQDDEFWEETWRGLSPAELKFLREELAHGFAKIESGPFKSPDYSGNLVHSGSNPDDSQRNATAVGKRRRWSEEEKALFVEGLKRLGKGRWKDISKFFVRSRTPSQIASYAQKYFLKEDKRRERLRHSDLHSIPQESSTASQFLIPATFQRHPQQHIFEAPLMAPEYLLGDQYYGEQNLPNLFSLPPRQSNQQLLPCCHCNQRVHPGALVPDPSYQVEHQSHQTGYMNQRQMHSGSSTQYQFYEQTHAEPLFRSQTLDVIQSSTTWVMGNSKNGDGASVGTAMEKADAGLFREVKAED